jgi:hypothetical protein
MLDWFRHRRGSRRGEPLGDGSPCLRSLESHFRRNPDLLVWKNGILTRYYEESTLESDLARTVFLFPDKLR